VFRGREIDVRFVHVEIASAVCCFISSAIESRRRLGKSEFGESPRFVIERVTRAVRRGKGLMYCMSTTVSSNLILRRFVRPDKCPINSGSQAISREVSDVNRWRSAGEFWIGTGIKRWVRCVKCCKKLSCAHERCLYHPTQ
jgi:hypothetical protein